MAGLDAFGTTLERSDMVVPTPAFAAIGNVTSFGGPEMEKEAYDVTAHDSPDKYREFIGGLIDAGEFSIEVNYDPAKHDTLVADFEDETPRDYRLTFPGGASWAFKAILTGFNQTAPVDDKLAAEIGWKLTGKPVLTPAA